VLIPVVVFFDRVNASRRATPIRVQGLMAGFGSLQDMPLAQKQNVSEYIMGNGLELSIFPNGFSYISGGFCVEEDLKISWACQSIVWLDVAERSASDATDSESQP